MKTLVSLLTATLLLAAFAPPAKAREPVSLDFFYDNLEPYGSWREVGDYGYCWQPRDVNRDWRPYSDGRWVYSDAGWTWDSDEPYGWAVYHYVGWAPLPPEALFLRAVGLSGWVDDYYDIGPRSYRFVESRNFGSHRLNSVFIDPRENLTIIHETTNITNITYQGDFVHNGGPRYDQQSRLSAEPIHRYKLDRRQDFDGDPRQQSSEHLRSRINGDSLSMMALPFDGRSSSGPHKPTEKLSRVEVDHGWKNAGSPAEIDEARAHMKSKMRTPDELPPRAKFDKPGQGETLRQGDRPPGPKNDVTKPGGNRDDKPRRPDAPPTSPTRKPDSVERPSTPKFEPNREKPKQPNDAPKPQQERKPKMEQQRQQPEQRSEKKHPDPKPEAAKPNPQVKRPEAQPPAKPPQQNKPKGKGKPDDKDKDKNKKNGDGLN
jgi:hypothetical protein